MFANAYKNENISNKAKLDVQITPQIRKLYESKSRSTTKTYFMDVRWIDNYPYTCNVILQIKQLETIQIYIYCKCIDFRTVLIFAPQRCAKFDTARQYLGKMDEIWYNAEQNKYISMRSHIFCYFPIILTCKKDYYDIHTVFRWSKKVGQFALCLYFYKNTNEMI